MRLVALVLVLIVGIAADAPLRVSGQLLDYEKGFVFFTTGDGFRMAPSAQILDYKTGGATKLVPAPRVWARATFDASGDVTELDLSKTKVPAEGNFADVQRYAVALSPMTANPDLVGSAQSTTGYVRTYSGRSVTVFFTVRVPPTTPLASTVYMSTDQSGWNPQAYRMNRIDALHYQIVMHLRSGTVLNILYTRGSTDTQERGPGNVNVTPQHYVVSDADVSTVPHDVYAWADQNINGQPQQPLAIPTPYNPAPFPNLPPGAPGAPRPTPHP